MIQVDADAKPGVAARIVDGTRVYPTSEGEVRALDGLTLSFPSGRFTTVMGPSGSGKSTLLHCLAGLDRLSSGQVFLGEVELGALSRRRRTIERRQRVGVVFQGFNLHPGLDIAQNIGLPAAISGHRPDRGWVDGVIDRLGLSRLLDRRPSELSGGEQQRVAAARALVGRPGLLLADEPTGNLDTQNGRALLEVLRLAVDELGQTVILVTHDIGAACVGDEAVVLGDGKLVEVVPAPTIETLSRHMLRLSPI